MSAQRYTAFVAASPESVRNSDAISAIQAWARNELNQYALAVRKLAYSLPHGLGERDLLHLSERMRLTAKDDLGKVLSTLGLTDPPDADSRHARDSHRVESIRTVIPEWPDTNGVPWKLCSTCLLVYDPMVAHSHDGCGQDGVST